ncbi:hypothetical protein Peur_033515 [Populus x canadensis]
MPAVARLLTVALLLEFTVPCEVTGGNTNQCSEGKLFIKRWKSEVFFFLLKQQFKNTAMDCIVPDLKEIAGKS